MESTSKKKTGKNVLMTVTLAALLLVAGCGALPTDELPEDESSAGGSSFTVTAGKFDSKIKEIMTTPGNYVLNLTGDLFDYPGVRLRTAGVNITVKGTGTNTIVWKYPEATGTESPSSAFEIYSGAKLTLENIEVRRGGGGTGDIPLIKIRGGSFELKTGARLSNHNDETAFFTGVDLNDEAGGNGAFVMSGGIIEKCHFGMFIKGRGHSVTVTGGIIRNNFRESITAGNESSECTFNITGGEFSGNDNNGHGIKIVGTGHRVTVSGGNFRNNTKGMTIGGTGNIATVSGGNFNNNTEYGFGLNEGSGNNTVTVISGEFNTNRDGIIQTNGNTTLNISGGTFRRNTGHGLRIDGNGNIATISGGESSDNDYNGLSIGGTGHSVTVSGGEFRNNRDGFGVYSYGENCTLNIRAGTFHGNTYGNVGIRGNRSVANVSGGEFTNSRDGINVLNEAVNCTLNITAGTIRGNTIQGVGIGGNENIVTVSGGEFTNNQDGIGIWREAVNCTLNITAGTIHGNTYNGVKVNWGSQGAIIAMNGGEIHGNRSGGVWLDGSAGTKFTMNGGSIGGNSGYGLYVSGANTGFIKQSGAVIYGNGSGENSNTGGAISVGGYLSRGSDAERGVVYAATINAEQSGIVPGSQQPENW